MAEEFEEIAHSGGKITFSLKTNSQGGRSYQVGWSANRPVPTALIAVYALSQGIPVGMVDLGGIGSPMTPAPFPGCFLVFIASDSQGKFGHHCPSCGSYWRSGPWPNVCPYCAVRAPGFEFFSKAQLRYVHLYCEKLEQALSSMQDGETIIDMDEVADAVGKEGEKPEFYVSERSQQRKFACVACDEFNDILGRFGYCSRCGTRNDLADFEGETVQAIRDRLNNGEAPENCVRDAVASFDSFMAQVGKELARLVPLTERRRRRLTTQAYHDLDEIRSTMLEWFDIEVCAGMVKKECEAVRRMFFRRHVYEHNGGEVDQRYLDNSGDTSVCLKQRIHETKEGAHELLSSLVKMVRNVHGTFHELLPPFSGPIDAFAKKKARMAKCG